MFHATTNKSLKAIDPGSTLLEAMLDASEHFEDNKVDCKADHKYVEERITPSITTIRPRLHSRPRGRGRLTDVMVSTRGSIAVVDI
jgi:hypothetical protein